MNQDDNEIINNDYMKRPMHLIDSIRHGLIAAGLCLALGCAPADDENPSSDEAAQSGMSDEGGGAVLETEDAAEPANEPAAPTELPFATGGDMADASTSDGLPTVDDEGNALNTIAALERAVEYYNRVLRTRVAESEEEEKYFKPVPPLTDLQQLIQYRIIRAVPAGPDGRKYVYDAEAGKVKLVGP
jgi:hypothetical protein